MASLSYTPHSLSYGTVPVAGTSDLSVDFHVNKGGAAPVQWIAALSGPDAAQFAITFNDGGADPDLDGIITVRFSPTSPGAKSATLTVTSSPSDPFNNGPLVIALTGTAGAGGYLTLSPQTTNDFGSVKDGTPSSVLNVLVQNNSGTDVIVTAIAFNGDFTAGGALPGLPFTQHANHVDAAKMIPVIFTPSLTGFRVTANAVEVTSNATNNPTDQAMQGTGFILTPAFSIPFNPQAVLMAFALGSAVVVLQVDEDDLDCEEPASFKRVYDWGDPLMEKYLGRVILRYEDESVVPFDFIVTGVAPRAPSPVIKSVINQGGLNDGLVHNAFADLQITDDLVQVQVSRDALDGPLVITEIFHEVDKRGEVIPP